MSNYGQELRALRERADIPAKRLAEKLGITPGYLSLLESGGRAFPEPDFLRAKAALLELIDERQKAFERAKAGAL